MFFLFSIQKPLYKLSFNNLYRDFYLSYDYLSIRFYFMMEADSACSSIRSAMLMYCGTVLMLSAV